MSGDGTNATHNRGIHPGASSGSLPQGIPGSSRPAAAPSSMAQNAPAALNPLQHAPHPGSTYRQGSGAGLQVRATGTHATAQGVFGQNYGYGSQQQRTQQPTTQPSYGQPSQPAQYGYPPQQVPYGQHYQPSQPAQYGYPPQQVPYGQHYQPFQPAQYGYPPQQVPYSQPYQSPQQGLGLGQLFGNVQQSGQTMGNRIGAILDSVMSQPATGFQPQMAPAGRTLRMVQSNRQNIDDHPDYPEVTAGKIPHGYKWTYKEEPGKPTKAVGLTVLYEQGGVLKERDYIYYANGAHNKVEPKRKFSKEQLDRVRRDSAAYHQNAMQSVQQPHQTYSAPPFVSAQPPQVPTQPSYDAQPLGAHNPFRNPVPMPPPQAPIVPPPTVAAARATAGSLNAEGIYVAGPPSYRP